MNINASINTALGVIKDQQDGINQLYSSLQNPNSVLHINFIKACNLLFKQTGKVVLSGVGKSGHIATKIASTLASTGTSAFFVHPTEALHGDLGMIKPEDTLILFSNSGNSVELSGLIQYAHRFNINIICVTKNLESDLAKNSNIVLQLPNAKEACVLGLAPTTSSTLTLVLGDALAVALLEMKGFSKDDFRIFHPGGALGSKLLKIESIMHKGSQVPLVTKDTLMQDAIIEITKHKFGCVGVAENNTLLGVITDGDIRRNMDENFLNKSAQTVMTTNFTVINTTTTTEQAVVIMNNKKITNCFVVDLNNKIAGIVHIHDLLHFGVR